MCTYFLVSSHYVSRTAFGSRHLHYCRCTAVCWHQWYEHRNQRCPNGGGGWKVLVYAAVSLCASLALRSKFHWPRNGLIYLQCSMQSIRWCILSLHSAISTTDWWLFNGHRQIERRTKLNESPNIYSIVDRYMAVTNMLRPHLTCMWCVGGAIPTKGRIHDIRRSSHREKLTAYQTNHVQIYKGPGSKFSNNFLNWSI